MCVYSQLDRSCTHSEINVKQILICTVELSSLPMSAGKVSNLVAFYKHAACNTEQNCVT
jgi:hypothetical protein